LGEFEGEGIFARLLCPPSSGEPLGGITALRAVISRGFLGNEFQLFPANTTKLYLQRDLPRSGLRPERGD